MTRVTYAAPPPAPRPSPRTSWSGSVQPSRPVSGARSPAGNRQRAVQVAVVDGAGPVPWKPNSVVPAAGTGPL